MNEHDYFKEEYIAANGRHFNESLARKVVNSMWHEGKNGDRVEGEAVTPSESMRLLEGMDSKKAEKMQWDAYVAANATTHDIAMTGLSKNDIMNVAKWFWFHDDDMEEGCHKVFWYFFR